MTDKENLRDLGDYVFEEKELQPLIAEMQNLRARLPKENPRRKERINILPTPSDEEIHKLLFQLGKDLKKDK